MQYQWHELPEQLVDDFERMVIAPLRVQLKATCRNIEERGREAFERRNRDRPGDPHAGSVGLGYWIDDARRHGVANAFELGHGNAQLKEMVEQLNEFRRKPEPQPEPVAVGSGQWQTPELWETEP